MLDGTEPIVRGSVFEWRQEWSTECRSVHCQVQRVAEDGTWADFTMTAGRSSWGKRLPLPLAPSFVRVR